MSHRSIGSSINSNKHPYAKDDFEGTAETREAFARINNNNKPGLPLLTDKELEALKIRRKALNL